MKKIISLKGVSKWYEDFQALKNIDLEIKLKEKIVICGPSGSGKSTEKMSVKDLNISNLKSVEILNLLKNGGHCHANAAGIKIY